MKEFSVGNVGKVEVLEQKIVFAKKIMEDDFSCSL